MKKSKRYQILFSVLLLSGITALAQPSKTQLEKERSALLQRIKTIQQIVKQTERQQKESIGQLEALNAQIASNSLLIQVTSQELTAIGQEIKQRQRTIINLEKDLAQLQKEYAAMVYVGTKALYNMHTLVFIFSPSSFYDLLYRLRCVKQYVRIRQQHCLEIGKTKALLQAQQEAAAQRMQIQEKLLCSRQEESQKLTSLKIKQAQLFRKLTQQHTQCTQELKQHNEAVKRLDKLIKEVIQQTLQATSSTNAQEAPSGRAPGAQTSTTQRLTRLFRKSRGKLPWPVKKGFISKRFGITPHPVLQNVQVENLGVDIQTHKGSQVYPIFEGFVKAIAVVPGMQRVVIIQHGTYHSVYARLKHTTIEVGQHVHARTPIGTVYTNHQGTTTVQLQIWQGTQKLNPIWWLCKQ